jgi:hypothetical protein
VSQSKYKFFHKTESDFVRGASWARYPKRRVRQRSRCQHGESQRQQEKKATCWASKFKLFCELFRKLFSNESLSMATRNLFLIKNTTLSRSAKWLHGQYYSELWINIIWIVYSRSLTSYTRSVSYRREELLQCLYHSLCSPTIPRYEDDLNCRKPTPVILASPKLAYTIVRVLTQQ